MFTLSFSSAKRESIARTIIEHLRQLKGKKVYSRGIDKKYNCQLYSSGVKQGTNFPCTPNIRVFA